jgi:cbb3-type cytochrome oxidase subunit 3
MKLSDIMSAAGLTSWAEVGLIVSFLTFAAIVAYVFIVRSRASYEGVRNLPLDDDDGDGCQVRSSEVAGNRGLSTPFIDQQGNCGTADLAPPEASS